MEKKNRGGKRAKNINTTRADSNNAWGSLTTDEQDAVRYYTDVYEINSLLRADSELEDIEKELVKDLDSAISKAEIKEDSVVYRGIRLSAFTDENLDWLSDGEIAEHLNKKIGKTFSDKGYMSTSIDMEIAKNFSNGVKNGIVMKLNVKKGTSAIHIGDHSHFQNEKETLFGRNSVYQLKNVYVDFNIGSVVAEFDMR